MSIGEGVCVDMDDSGKLQPVLYLPHGGGPLPLLGDVGHAGLIRFLQTIAAELGKPAAIVLISAHWEESVASVTSGLQPKLIYDYSGFSPESYAISYPASGAPQLAETIAGLLRVADIECRLDVRRGFDHGMFVPLKLMYPQADIPCVQLSLLHSLDPAAHVALGRALAPLRRQGVLIIGSGLSFHNLRAFFVPSAEATAAGREFDRWLQQVCVQPGRTPAERGALLNAWSQAPHARFCHPREEHLLPLHVCFGAAAGASPVAEPVFHDLLMGQWVSGFLWR